MALSDYVQAIYRQRDKEVYQMHLDGFSYSKINAKYGIDTAQISRIVKKQKMMDKEKEGDLTTVKGSV